MTKAKRKTSASMRLYHGTSREACESIWENDVGVSGTRREPGDFGYGFYLTKSLVRARSYGPCVLEFLIDTRHYARVDNPYFTSGFNMFWPTTTDERLFYSLAFGSGGEMKTVKGSPESRLLAAVRIRNAFLGAGYKGIVTKYAGGEVVVFDADSIKVMSAVS